MIRTFLTPLKPVIKTLKTDVFISFNMEFKLKTSENYLKSIKNTETLRLIPIQLSNTKLFISFSMQFKLKYCRKLPKNTIFRYCDFGVYEIVLFVSL
jgi:hypothetical protein